MYANEGKNVNKYPPINKTGPVTIMLALETIVLLLYCNFKTMYCHDQCILIIVNYVHNSDDELNSSKTFN